MMYWRDKFVRKRSHQTWVADKTAFKTGFTFQLVFNLVSNVFAPGGAFISNIAFAKKKVRQYLVNAFLDNDWTEPAVCHRKKNHSQKTWQDHKSKLLKQVCFALTHKTAFSVSGPTIWNTLCYRILTPTTRTTQCSLTSHSFHKAFNTAPT